MDEHALRFKVVDTARLFIGAKQGSTDHKLIVDTYNSHQPLARGYKLKYTDAWCAGFVSAIAIMTDMTDIIPTEVGAQEQLQKFQKLGEFTEDDAYIPKEGDIVYYDWDDSGYGDNKGRADHVGIVESLGSYSFTVIEGNMTVNGVSQVGRREVDYNGRFIRGFGLPDYASKADTPDEMYIDTDELNIREDPSMAGDVLGVALYGKKVDVGLIEGDWAHVTLSGYVAKNYLSREQPKEIYTTTDALKMRKVPGTTGAVILTIPKGKKVKATTNTDFDGSVMWREVEYPIDAFPNNTGWVSGDYLK